MEIGIVDAEIWDPGLLDADNPRSLVRICPPSIREHVLNIPLEAFTMTEDELVRYASPDFTSKCLRIQFWQEYVRAQDKSVSMSLHNILKGVTHKGYFMHLAKTRPHELGWICVPPRSYDVMQKQILEESLEKMRANLSVGVIDEVTVEKVGTNGDVTVTTTKKVNASAMAEIRKTAEMLQNRIMGSMTANVNHKHTLEQANSGREEPLGLISINSLNEIDEILDAEDLGDTANDGGV